MVKNLIVLPNGTELYSGSGVENPIIQVKSTEAVNVGEELSMGSAFANFIDVTILTPNGNLSVDAGMEITRYIVDEEGGRINQGVYILEKPTRPTSNTMKLTGYDRIIKLDKDLSEWVNSLSGWPYSLITFAGMVCRACGLDLVTNSIPNADFPVYKFSASGVTGRKLMRWIGEICCRFCRASDSGDIELAWYTASGKTITPSGKTRYFANTLSYDTFETAKVDAVKLHLAENNGALWPVSEADNPYIINGNAILLARVTEDLLPYLQNIERELQGFSYTPCKVSIPSDHLLRPGHVVEILDKNGATIRCPVMEKTTNGQRDTISCTGSYRRDTSTASNNKPESEKVADAAQDAVNKQTQADIFKKLTNNGAAPGVFMIDGQVYVNATYISTGVLSSKDGKTFLLDLDSGLLKMHSIDTLEEKIESQGGRIADTSNKVSSIEETGAPKVKTATGYTFDADGIRIQKDGQEIENKLDHSGMYVNRGTEVMLQANADGVIGTDMTVRNYLVVGEHARFEDYVTEQDECRTACFWREGGATFGQNQYRRHK